MRTLFVLTLSIVACDPSAHGPRAVAVAPADAVFNADAAHFDAPSPPDAASAAADAGHAAGSRIKPVWLVSDDGAREHVGWFDSDLGVRCEFESAADGETRCVPSDRDPAVVRGEDGIAAVRGIFSDPGCVDRVVAAAWRTCAPVVLRDAGAVPASADCGRPLGSPDRIFMLRGLADVQDGAPLYAWTAGGSCEQADGAASGAYYRVGDEVSASELVRAAVEIGE